MPRTEFNSVLVPVDLNEHTDELLAHAMGMVSDGGVLVVLHVVDESKVRFAVEQGYAEAEEVVTALRNKAKEQLDARVGATPPGLEVDALVSVGVPFMEIVAKARDFDVDLVVMGKGRAQPGVEHLLFGSTAEKVLRTTRRPILIMP